MPVSERDIDTLREFFATFPERLRDMREGRFQPHYSRHYTDDHVMEMPDAFPTPGSFQGFDGYRQWFEEAYGPWEDVVWTLEEVEPVGDSIVVRALISGRPIGESVALEVRVGLVYEMREGRFSRTRTFLSHERALEAARADAAA